MTRDPAEIEVVARDLTPSDLADLVGTEAARTEQVRALALAASAQ